LVRSGSQGAKGLGRGGEATHDGGNAEVDPISLTEILCRHCGEGRGRRDSCHFVVSCVRDNLPGSSEVSPSPAMVRNHRALELKVTPVSSVIILHFDVLPDRRGR
jgi:hypothetical protein